jgi:hypothetical protein
MLIRRIFSRLLLAIGILIVSCASPAAPTSAPAPQPAAPTQTVSSSPATAQPTSPPALATQTAAPTRAATPTGTAKLNMDEIFPPGPGREAVLDNCTSCHTFVPIVVLQMTQAQWDRNARDHRSRVPRMTDGDFNAAYDYLNKNFGPNHPIPKLPKELLDTWTDY